MPLIQVYSQVLLVLSSAAEASGPFAVHCLSSLPSEWAGPTKAHGTPAAGLLGVEITAHCLWV